MLLLVYNILSRTSLVQQTERDSSKRSYSNINNSLTSWYMFSRNIVALSDAIVQLVHNLLDRIEDGNVP